MNQPPLSVVIPVHDAAPYLPALFEALDAQTLAGIAYIFVNDGSHDDSARLLDDYAASRPGVLVLHQQPARGVSAARNLGLAHIRGDYVGFCDADDQPAPDHYAQLYELACHHRLDIAFGNGCYFNQAPGDDHRLIVQQPKPTAVLDGAGWLDACLVGREWIYAVYLSLLRCDWLREHGLRFPEGMVHEDVVWTNELLLRAGRVAYQAAPTYHYRRTPGSIMRNRSRDGLWRRIDGHTKAAAHLQRISDSAAAALRPALRAQALIELNKLLGLLGDLDDWQLKTACARRLRRSGLFGWGWHHGGGRLRWRLVRASLLAALATGSADG
ncbi:glycosyltransferase [Chitinimonas lacunae]|uniref:Glycosyltransferase n=1 Tax=Chitinimonas lacunae TaxID=1963018 RepID=A0ABV8MNT3_9NEIS